MPIVKEVLRMPSIRWIALFTFALTASCHDGVLLGGMSGDGVLPVVVDSGAAIYDADSDPPLVYFYGDPFAVPASQDGSTIEGPTGAVLGTASGSSARQVLVTGAPSATSGNQVVVGADEVYYASTEAVDGAPVDSYSIRAISKHGGAPRVIVSGLPSVVTMATDGVDVYFVDQLPFNMTDGGLPPGIIARVPVDGGTVSQLIDSTQIITALAVAGGALYWGQIPPGKAGETQGVVARLALDAASGDGGSPESLATGQAVPVAIAVDEGNVYWLDEGTSPDGCALTGGSLVELRAGSTSPQVLASDLFGATSLAVDSSVAYFSTNGLERCSDDESHGAIWRAPADGGAASVVLGGLTTPGNLLASDFLYYTFQPSAPPTAAPLLVGVLPR